MAQQMLLDHVILLVPYKCLAGPPEWLTSFTLSPGGQHSDGKTENRLVLFRDGTYLELIAFVNDDPEKRAGHYWDKPYGVIDYALTTIESRLDYEALNDRLKNANILASYKKPQAGSRLRPDGVELKWEVTFPEGLERGILPFFCHDVKPRIRRVPITEENTTHPCGALGISGIIVEVDKNRLATVASCLQAIIGSDHQQDNQYQIGTPVDAVEARQPAIRLRSSSSDSAITSALTLVVQTEGDSPVGSIRQDIEGGMVTIDFEQ